MAKKAFSIVDYIQPADVSNSDTKTPQIELIDIDRIESNEDNFYELSNLEPLADSILMDGLQQPIIVTASPDDADKVRILSGHRRCAAIQMLVEDETSPRPELRLVPCIRKTYESSAMAELQLILANSTSRVLTSPEISKQAERTEALLYKLKEEGYSFPGRMRDQVAEACNVSASKLARLKVIRENLCSEAKIAFESGELCEASAYEVAKLLPMYQQKIFASKKATNLRSYDVSGLGNKLNKYFGPALKCNKIIEPKTGTPGYCDHGEAMWEHSKNKNSWEMCRGCCAECYENEKCKSVCPHCVEEIEKRKAERNEKETANKAERVEKRAKENEICFETWLRVAKVCLDYDVSYAEIKEECEKRNQWCFMWDDEEWHDCLIGKIADNDIFDVNLLVTIADLCDCSVDYLLARTDEPQMRRGGKND